MRGLAQDMPQWNVQKIPVALAWTVLIVLLGAILAPSFMIPGGPGQYFWATECQYMSPDGEHELLFEKRILFPANEIFDPRAAIRIVLSKTDTASVIHSETFTLDEESDFQLPQIRWMDTRVEITSFDDRRGELKVSFEK